ncbi:disease resistance protein At4g27190-like [Camellia sinensis]|uniref:disease resistance protein At4g27190-like n=1 Tax=Camellia sinensis TaxID=4442 RepID=UPI0010361742|nr:disease resistance protein At4g27190-like [Camellia sinensis]
MHVDRYVPMPVLSEKEAWALFKKTVGNSVYSPELHDIASLVCKECGGLPIIILTVGAALKYKQKHVWKSALDQLKKNIAGINPNVCASLKLSYNWLESRDVKSCFLLCCFFPEDDEISIEVLARHCIARSLLGQDTNSLREASHRVLTTVNHLKDACLLLEGKDENFVKMHNAIRKVAISIAKDDGKEILVNHGVKKRPKEDTCKSCSAISLRFDNTLELLDDLVCPQLHTLTILLKWNINPLLKLNVPDRFFRGMKKLTILELNRICVLPPLSLANLIRELTHLRLLDLGNCYKLTQIPQGVISNLSHLEELYIFDDFKPWEATRDKKERSEVNLDELGKLTQLTTLEIHIPNVMLLPKDFYFENLIRFKISIGMGKEYVFHGKPCKFGGVSLKIEGLQEGSLVERFGLNPLGFFNILIVLTIQDCKSKYHFSLSCARGILRLQKLQIIDCKMMEAIVGIEEEKDEDELSSQVIHFSQLEYLCLENLPKLISFYPKVEKMTSEGNSSNQAQFLLNEKVH